MCKGPEWKRVRLIQRSEAIVAAVQSTQGRDVHKAEEVVRGQVM